MAHLMMIESWVGASGNLLPPLLKEMGHTYTFVTRKPQHYASLRESEPHPVLRYADDVIVAETNDTAALLKRLRSLSFDGVITVCDYYIETVQQVAEALGVPCPFPKAVKTVRHKHRMRQALDEAGLPNPPYRLADNWADVERAAETLGYPLVLKPVDLASSAFVRLVSDRRDLEDAYRALERFPRNFRDQPRDTTYLLEAYMRGEEISVETVTWHGETTVIGVTDKSVTGAPYFIEDGHMFPAPVDEITRSAATGLVLDALRAVGYDHGVAHTEVKLTTEGPRIVEINPRTAGNYIVELIERVTGINLLRAFVDLALGQKPSLDRRNTGVTSAAVQFIVPSQGGLLKEIHGIESLGENEHIVRFHIDTRVGRRLDPPVDNACYLGHVVAVDPSGMRARCYAEEAVGRITLAFASEGEPM